MRLLCPDCCSEDIDTHPDPRAVELRCGNCGAGFDRDQAHVTVAEAQSHLPGPASEKLFELDGDQARAQLLDPDGAIHVVDPHTDAEELESLLWLAREEEIIRARRARAAIRAHTLSAWSSRPLLIVDPGAGPTLLGPELDLGPRDDEDSVAFTIRILAEIVDAANRIAAHSARLDNIAAFLNGHRPWNGGDVCEFLATEIVASGRRLLDAEE